MKAAVLCKYDAPLVIQEVDIPAIGPKGLRIIGCRASTRRDLAEVISWVEEKKILPLVEDILPLAKVNEAYARLRLGQVISRLVIVP